MNNFDSRVPPRSEIRVGRRVWAVEKRNYASGELTEGVVKRILTSKAYHSRGIKVMLKDGTVARVQRLTPPEAGSAESVPSEKITPVDLDAEGELR
ncbi:MAG: hypothetical protein BMS9Abin34_376 [Patescibacteria group bacterium]|nr:MAG: hypothetical protein BMS9Abin34_376 [Patescibacteria group bacterium]